MVLNLSLLPLLTMQIVRYFEGEELSLEMHFRTIAAMRAGNDK